MQENEKNKKHGAFYQGNKNSASISEKLKENLTKGCQGPSWMSRFFTYL